MWPRARSFSPEAAISPGVMGPYRLWGEERSPWKQPKAAAPSSWAWKPVRGPSIRWGAVKALP